MVNKKKRVSKGVARMPERVTLLSLLTKFAKDPTTKAVAKSVAKGVAKATRAGIRTTGRAITQLRDKRREDGLTPIEERKLEALENAELALLRKRKQVKSVV